MFGLQMSKAPRHARAHGLPPATAISYASQGGLLKRARAALNRTLFDKQHDNDNEQQHNTGRSTSMGETQKENVGLQQQQQQQEPYTGCAYLSCGRALVQLPPGVDDDKNSGNVSVSQRVIEPVISHALYKPCDMPIIDHCLTTSSVENALALIDFIQYACHHDNATTAMNNNIRNANDSNDTPTMTIKCPSTFIDYGDLKGDGNNDNINTTSIAQPNTEETEKKKNVRVRRVRYSGFCNSGLATAAIHCARDAVNQGKCRWATVFATAPHAHAVWKGSSARSGKPGFSIDAAELFIVSKTQVVAAQLRPPCDAV